ncbi:Rossmann fold nucleotide-binding protein Smf possibly involved in DNA uptake [Alloactinosynnema sp. L-07]|uniref:DNA-processing protein DprA n=1 Tax=Alloactinosynnema sp. L-07 TaxID=1653480 RepID=UPI00065EFB9E|nr:DNA-processing protein DprA [Alloactinosynnema sp. L-07]CRK58618.1 Rossmann fold nucleotide-binding protein Smf possibly involved in DNA uptake [Alloactinosynnema sp. L-07]
MSPLATDDPARRARAYLLRVAEPPAPALAALVDVCGPVEAAARVRAGEAPRSVMDETSARRESDFVDVDLAAAQAVGARLLTPEDPEWPEWPLLALRNAHARGLRWAAPPLALWVRGPTGVDSALRRSVSVIGARAATGYGEHVAAEFGYGLAEAGMTVVSGAAYGIDGAAHRGALNAEGTTIAVLGCGVDVRYPASHARLLDRIGETGAVISEYPPGTPPAKHRFLVRNRLIAALSAGTVVVEAGVRSGARNTASTAAALGKTVLAVPGPITSAMSLGCHELLRTGSATVVCSVAEVLEGVGQVGVDLAPEPTRPKRTTDGLGDQALRVHEALPLGKGPSGLSPERVAALSGVPLARVRALLPELEMTGLVVRGEEGWHRSRS